MLIDSTADFYLLDDSEPLTLQVVGSEDVAIPAAISIPIALSTLSRSGGFAHKGDRRFAWPRNVTLRPPLGAKILDGNGEVWTILSADAHGIIKTWDVHARSVSIAFRLDNLAAVEKKLLDAEGLPIWTEILSGIAARFQPVDQTVFHVYLSVDIFAQEISTPVLADYRLADSAGQYYSISQYQYAQQIDTLPVASCARIVV